MNGRDEIALGDYKLVKEKLTNLILSTTLHQIKHHLFYLYFISADFLFKNNN